MNEPRVDQEELRQPADPAAKDQPAEGGREEIDEDLRRADEREPAPDAHDPAKRT
jgi:hypothetical protein